MIKIASYAAELMRDLWYQSERLGQRPVLRSREVIEPEKPSQPLARAQAASEDFGSAAAASQIGRVTRETLRAIAFPTFVADLIRGTFNAIVQSSIQQMEAYSDLLENVGKTVDGFMDSNLSDNQARDWLAMRYPEHLHLNTSSGEPRLEPREGADERPLPNWREDLHLTRNISLDEDQIEEHLVPAARRRLAEMRLQMLSTMVLMGMNRIVVTGGKIRATMQFHIDTTDRAHEERATDFDLRHAAAYSGTFPIGTINASHSIAYVSSTRNSSDSELNVDANLMGEVEIHFKSDYFPLERFATSGHINTIRGNTAVPEANTPVTASGEAISWGPNVDPLPTRRSERAAPTLRAIGTPLPDPRRPVEPDAVRILPRAPNADLRDDTPRVEEKPAAAGGDKPQNAKEAPKAADSKGKDDKPTSPKPEENVSKGK
jgi:hypothetical protein